MKIQLNKLLMGVCLASVAMMFSSCNDEWNEHYSPGYLDANGVNQTVYDALCANPDLSDFVDSINMYGYDKLLKSNRTFTVFAPTNAALRANALNTEYSIKESLIKNNIAYFIRSINAHSDTTVTMLNKKVMRVRGGKFGDKQDPTVLIDTTDIICKNGLVHIIGGVTPYIPNLWEIIHNEAPDYSKYLSTRDVEMLNIAESTIDSVGTDGRTIYLDSVLTYSNEYWQLLGELNEEDSTFVTLVLDDTAWARARAQIAQSFNYYPAIQASSFYIGDRGDTASVRIARDSLLSLQANLINFTILQTLSYRLDAITQLLADTYRPGYDFIGSVANQRLPKETLRNILLNTPTDKVQSASNGKAYILDAYNFKNYEVLERDTIKLEAENLQRMLRLSNANMSTQSRRFQSDEIFSYTQDPTIIESVGNATITPGNIPVELYQPTPEETREGYRMSGSACIAVAAASTVSAGLTYGISNTYSGNYDVWVTFAPADQFSSDPKTADITVTTKYSRVNPTSGSITFTNIRTSNFKVDPTAITKVKVADNIPLDPCFYGFLEESEPLYTDPNNVTLTDLFGKKYGVNVTVTNSTRISSNESDHNLYIDCIELVPHRDN